MSTKQIIPYARSANHEHSAWYIGNLVTFLAESADTNGQFCLVELTGREGDGPPRHLHTREDEGSYVVEGEMLFHVDGRDYPAPAGTFVLLPRGLPHFFRVQSETAKWITFSAPGGHEGFFREMSKPARELTLPPPEEITRDIQKNVLIGNKYGMRYPDHQPAQ